MGVDGGAHGARSRGIGAKGTDAGGDGADRTDAAQ